MDKSLLEHQFTQPLLAWFDQFGRKDLPWQHPRSAYRVWISEIMLQQTQVKTVIPYFLRFIERFPTVADLAMAAEDEVMALWAGLGYYSRARNLYRCAQIIALEFSGEFPQTLETLMALPGLGQSTSAAILSQAFNLPEAILDGNVKRVLARYFMLSGWPEQSAGKKQFWHHANLCMPSYRCADYTQAIMDLGATCCTTKNPNCSGCPLSASCKAYLNDQVKNFPEKKPKKSLPTKLEQFLLLHNTKGQIYLEKRPAHGIWGGLWCLPVIDENVDPASYLQDHYFIDCQQIEPLLEIKHSFSHYHLKIQALAVATGTIANFASEKQGGWYKGEELGQLGLAKPVSDILKHFFEGKPR
ncbi:A/G-specific adenine glycosylase [Legionella birminghamensis]|uniref:Adenine DNA glycosylase n=1 Tax=Legionella birminghamensis TaxID=28083 RepID=A0A378I8J0_9GAMM|nr:A/G-specific adenine glycosylase [Legionella birminghamensis]KTC74666.1 A/G-specific adenine glycosylase [Legionella birminghamensis]STX31469.1 A/G-specific adenine glycosylase [Legionella birminghamensis]